MAVTYSYDLLDRLVEKSYHETGKPDLTIRYTYNAESQLARLRYEEDGETVGSYAFEYDSLGRLIRSTAMDENGFTMRLTASPARAGRSARRPTRSATPTATGKKATAA